MNLKGAGNAILLWVLIFNSIKRNFKNSYKGRHLMDFRKNKVILLKKSTKRA
jgi:hypothetical protein